MTNRWASQQPGFTIVELLVVIVVIGILAALVVVAFNGVQNQATLAAIKSDLTGAVKAMEAEKVMNGSYPTSLPATIKSSPGITLTLVPSTLPYYAITSPVQSGVLLSQICQDLVNEGKGSALNAGGGTDPYITGCGNWNHDSMQVTGWTSKVFSTPITDTTFSDYAATIPAGDAWHPNQQSTIRNFYLEMQSRVAAQGGSFPITTFWDSWATPGNGVMYQALPSPSASSGMAFCLQAAATNGTVWRARQQGSPVTGAC